MTVEPSSDADGEETLNRRRFLAGAASLGAAAATPAFVGTAAGQSESQQNKTTPVAVQNTAPTFENDDYVGLFLQVSGYDREASQRGVGSCEFAGSQEDLTGYDVELIDTASEANRSEPATMFAVTEGTNVQVGKLFVVDEQSACNGGYVTLQLEEVGSSSIQTPGAAGGSETESSIPGFGVLAGALGLGAAGAAAAARSDDD